MLAGTGISSNYRSPCTSGGCSPSCPVLPGHPPDNGYKKQILGSRTVNSVNSPTWLSTVIVPPSSWVTMS